MELAGFDILGELSIDTLSDFVNSNAVSLPDGSSVYLLGGKFVLNLPISLAGVGSGSAALFCQASLSGVARTASCALTLDLTDGALTFGPLSIRHVAGTVVFTAQLGPVPDPTTGAAPNRMVPAILNAYATSTMAFDAATASVIDGTLGAGMAVQIELAISSALEAWFRSRPTPTVAAYGFTVVPGQDSHSPLQLSAPPQVFWIDQSTLGVFGYYRSAASGGNVEWKTESDIVQPGPEFVYLNSELFNVIPARRVAVLMSAAGFQLTLACPMISSQIVRGLVEQQYEDQFIALVRAELGQQYYAQEASKNLIAYFLDEEKKAPGDLQGDFNRAKAHVQADVDNDIRAEAIRRLQLWLNGPVGQVVIAGSVPPSCGTGSVQASRQHMPDPFSDVVSTLRELDVELQDGFVSFFAKADGNLPVCGDFSVTQSGQVHVVVDDSTGRVAPLVHTDPTQVDISVNPLCKIAASILVDLFEGVTWGTAIVFIGAAIAEGIGEGLVAKIIEQKIEQAESGIGSYSTGLPANSRLLDIEIETVGIRTTALLGRDVDHYNRFVSQLQLEAIQLSRTANGQPAQGEMSVEANAAGCAAESFIYSLQRYDTSFQVSLHAINLPLPIQVTSWQLQIGNFEYTSLGYLINDVKLPGPYWTGSLQEVITPATTLEGSLWHPVPPLDGAFETRNVVVQLSGSPDAGWKLDFSGFDGCFYLQITCTAEDGDGQVWTGQTFLSIHGEEISFGQDYLAYKADCDRKKMTALLAKIAHLRPYANVIVGRVAPGAPVESAQAVVNQSIRGAIHSVDRNVYLALVAAVRQFGKPILQGFTAPGSFNAVGRENE